MVSGSKPIQRVLTVAIISGAIGIAITLALMLFVLASSWFLFILPAIMGWAIKKFSHITADEVRSNPNLDKKVGWVCAGITLAFVLFIALLVALGAYIRYGQIGYLFLNVPFLLVSFFSVWFGYRQGVGAVVDSYYDDNLANSED